MRGGEMRRGGGAVLRQAAAAGVSRGVDAAKVARLTTAKAPPA